VKGKELLIRKWLNKKGYYTTAAVFLQQNERWDEDTLSLDGVLGITDCSRKIDLDLYCATQRDAKNALYKLDILLETIQAARDFIAERAKLLPRP